MLSIGRGLLGWLAEKKKPSADKTAEDEKETPTKRKYVPKARTANHAFLVVLLEVCKWK